MVKNVFVFVFILLWCNLYGQTVKTVDIDVVKTDLLNLSDIAEDVIAVPLDDTSDILNRVFMTDKYLFVCGLNSFCKYDLSGKLLYGVKITEEFEYINDITGDAKKEMLFVAVGNKLLFYDFACNQIKEVEAKYPIERCFFHDEKIWIQSGGVIEDNINACRISYWDMSLNKETFTSFEHKPHPIIANAVINPYFYFSIFENKPVFSFGDANVIYRFDGINVKPVIKWNIDIPIKTPYERGIFNYNGVVGKYLIVNYIRYLTQEEEKKSPNTSYLYVEDMKTKKAFNVKFKGNRNDLILDGLKDDIYHTGYCKIEHPLNKEGYFYFTKTPNEIKKNPSVNIPVKSGPVVFIVKTKK